MYWHCKCFGKQVCQVVVARHIFDSYIPILYCVMYEVVPNVNVLAPLEGHVLVGKV